MTGPVSGGGPVWPSPTHTSHGRGAGGASPASCPTPVALFARACASAWTSGGSNNPVKAMTSGGGGYLHHLCCPPTRAWGMPADPLLSQGALISFGPPTVGHASVSARPLSPVGLLPPPPRRVASPTMRLLWARVGSV